MTTTAAPELQTQVCDRLSATGRTAQFASYFSQAQQGTLSRQHALLILRQLGNVESPAEGEAQIEMPRCTGTATSHRSNDASEKQAAYAVSLLRERVRPEERVTGSVKTAAEVLAAFGKTGVMSKAMARNVIDSYKDRPRAPRVEVARPATPQAPKPAPVELVPGIYQVGDDIFKVQKSRQSGRLYAQKLVDGRWDYDAGWGAMRFLKAEHLMSTEQARAFGQRFGMCVNGHPLSDRVSRYFGYGECCANKNGWLYDKKLVPADFE